jgi:predicted amidohydrolase YtcJ
VTGKVGPRAERKSADRILVDGFIYTMEQDRPTAEAVAIRDGRIIGLGTSQEVRELSGKKTEIIDLQGRMVMPGLIDGHCHPTKGAIANLFSCKFEFTATSEDIARILSEFVERNPATEWIIGGRWESGFFDNNLIPSPRRWLDQYSGDKAVYLRDDSGHNGWANTRALQLADLTRDTKDPEGGRIIRDPDTGEPNGLLLEEADTWMKQRAPDWTEEQYQAGVLEMVRIANGYGITGVNDADATEPLLKAYRDADRAGALSLHVAASISTPYGTRDTPLDYDRIEALRDRYASDHVDTRFAKIYEDGVPTAARTAAMLAPYLPHDDFPEAFTGLLHVDEATLTKDLTELETRGFTVKLHTAGDRSIRVALNAIEKAHQASGRSDLRHELSHAGFVAPSDIPRFKQLNAVADLSPYIWHPSPILQSISGALGERGMRYWPIRDLLEAGAPMLAGSDWPAAVSSMDPWAGIEAMVTRRDPKNETPGALWPEQAIRLEQALRIFTIEGAKALRLEAETGSIQVGKAADLIVLGQNLFAIEPEEIGDTTVEITLFAGEIVHREE